jgi:predicted ATPase
LAQVAIEGLQSEFPPLKTAGAPGTRLPSQLSSFIGRRKELGEIARFLENARLLTLVGPGGTGKTRLSIEAARIVADQFAHGVHWVPLAGVMDADQVASEIADALELHVDPTRPTADALIAHLHERELLLVVDNAEQVANAAPLIGELLAAAPHIAVLVTSRSPLRLPGEQQYHVPPLDLPGRSGALTVDDIRDCAAVHLFLVRAREVDARFELTDANASAIAEICTRLDGLPLAIELAAARVDVLPPEAIRARMEQRLSLLASRRTGVDERQRTLRGAIDWSYGLLHESLAGAFRRVGVFVGGFTLDAAAAVAGDISVETVDAVAGLLEASLLRREASGGQPRYRMLETVREYAMERLKAEGEADATHGRAASHWLSLVAPIAEELHAGAPEALATVENDYDNIRGALHWALGGAPGQSWRDPSDAALGTKLSAAMGAFWQLTHVREGSAWMTRALECAIDQPAELRAALSFLAGVLYDGEGRVSDARASLTASLALFRETGDKGGEARALNSLGVVARGSGELEEARSLFEDGLKLRRELGMPITTALNNLGVVATDRGDLEEARDHYARALELDELADDRVGVATDRSNLAAVALRARDVAEAEAMLRQSLPGFAEAGDTVGIAEDLERWAEAALLRGELERAAVLFAAASALRQAEGIPQPAIDRRRQDGLIADLRTRLADPFPAAWERGEALSPEAAIAYALDVV